MELEAWLGRAVRAVRSWEDGFGAFETHPSLRVDEARFDAAFGELTGRLRDNYPYFHPFYAGQMLKPPHPAAVAGYLAAMLINPNNHALDGGPATSAMEKEVVADLAAMFGYGAHLGHLTSSGTIANLEALYVARESHPGLGVAYSTEAHYTHGRMCGVLGVPGFAVPVDGLGRMDTGALDALLAKGRVGTVVATAGTTGLGAIDPVHTIAAVAGRHGVRVHVDAAYGGFFTLLAGLGERAGLDPAPWRAIASCDSVVVDPHKHGLQPYGCGAVLFRDPSVGRFYQHDSPYTYFTSDELHLGEISLECSRAGASAVALWATQRLLPLVPEGEFARGLAAGHNAALEFDRRLRNGGAFAPFTSRPELDIVVWQVLAGSASQNSALAQRIFDQCAALNLHLALVQLPGAMFTGQAVAGSDATVTCLRSVLMKPEHAEWLDAIWERLTAAVSMETGKIE